jgi:hypothetical protein
LLLAGLLVLAASRIDANGTPTAVACGVELWSLKTLSDPQRALVKLRPKSTSVAAINRLPMPHPTPSTRKTVFERRVWRVRAQIVEYKLEDDQDIHLVLFDRGAYLIAEMPSGACLTARTRDRRALVRVRRVFETRCGAATSSWRPLGAESAVVAASAVRAANKPRSLRIGFLLSWSTAFADRR